MTAATGGYVQESARLELAVINAFRQQPGPNSLALLRPAGDTHDVAQVRTGHASGERNHGLRGP